MAKDKIDQAREKRIQMEIVVDGYNESERYSGWICYLEDKLEFPFQARCVAPRKSSPLKSGEKVEIMSMLDEDCDEPSEIFCKRDGKDAGSACHWRNWKASESAIRPPRPLPTGITGAPANIVSNF